jgi:hypothetical protein
MGEWQYNGTGSTSTIWTAGTNIGAAVLAGSNSVASGKYAVAEGSGNTASGHYSHAEGTISIGDAIGGTVASGLGSHAEGGTTEASGNYSHAEGRLSHATNLASHAEGYDTTASAKYSHAEGNNTAATREAAHSEGKNTTASGSFSHSEGFGNLAVGTASHAEGYQTAASGYSSHSEGRLTTASGNYGAHVEGYKSTAIGDGSHAEGGGVFISGGVSISNGSHAEGYGSKTGFYALRIDNMTSSLITVNNLVDYSSYFTGNTVITDVGVFTYTSIAYDTPSAGDFTIYISDNYDGITTGTRFAPIEYMNDSAFRLVSNGRGGDTSHAEGQYTAAAGVASHSEGKQTTALGNYSHAGGYNTTASGLNSFVHGENSKAGNNNTIVFGKDITGTSANTVYVPSLIINTGGTGSMLGINTSTPDYVIDVNGNNARLILADTYTGADLPFKGFALSANSTNVPQIAAATNSYLGGFGLSLGMGVLGDNVTSTSNTQLLGTSGDTFISSSQKTNNLNIINRSGGSGTNHIRMYAGVNSVSAAAEPDFQIQGTGTTRGFIGIKTGDPQYLIDARGHLNNRFFYDPTFAGNSGTLTMSATTGLPTIGVFTYSGVVSQSGGISIGMRAWNDTVWDAYGKQGDAHVYSSKQSNGLVLISSDGIGTEDYIKCYVGGDANGSGALAIHMHGTGVTKGYVGFNTDLPTQQIDVNGNGRFRSIGSSASSGALHYTADGTLTINTSDERLKTNITTLNGALNKVNQLRGVTYNWKENPSGDTRIGFIAQEVNSVVPELTFTNPNSADKYMGVHYDNVTALLVEAVKELSSGIIKTNNTYLETQTILAEDNNIDLNYSGTPESAIGGGIRVLHALGVDSSAELITDSEGNFITNNDFKPNSLTIPYYKPNSSEDINGNIGNITRDDEYLYIKCQDGWRRSSLERF